MRRMAMLTGIMMLGASLLGGPATAAAVPSATGGTWGKAREIPGTAALNQFGAAHVYSVSCASPGNCGAGGYYTDYTGRQQAFVADQVNGTWDTAIEVPGLAALNNGFAQVISVSCTSPGNCGAGGDYRDLHSNDQAFVVSETGGTWGKAELVPGSAALNVFGNAEVLSVSCASPGNCGAGGYYTDRTGNQQAFVVSQTGGTWGKAKQVGGPLGGYFDRISSVSCAAAGDCSAAGVIVDRHGNNVAIVVSETSGTWGRAQVVPGTRALNTGSNAQATAVSCASPGNCGVGGQYTDSSGHLQAFVVSEHNGTWGTAQEAPGMAALNTGGAVLLDQMSCASPGNCGAGGFYTNTANQQEAFVISQQNGTWRPAIQVPGTASLSPEGYARTNSVSCPAPGDCIAAGEYTGQHHHDEAFIVSQQNGTWGAATAVPGIRDLNLGGKSRVSSLSCAQVNRCSAGGDYEIAHTVLVEVFAVSETS